MTDWCILRTGAASTLRLADSLTDAGFEAWTPMEVRDKRKPRSTLRVEVIQPITPTFVFADHSRLDELLSLSHAPSLIYQVWDKELRRMVTKGHPYFTVFRFAGEYPRIPDAQLSPLRTAEARLKRKPRGKPPTFNPGDVVRLTEGGFAGLTGEVRTTQGKFAMVRFPGFPVEVKISVFLLHPTLDQPSPVYVNEAKP